MKRTLMIGLLSVALLPTLSGCGQSPEDERRERMEDAAGDLEDAADRLEDAAGESGDEMTEAMEGFAEALGGAMGAANGGDDEEYDPVEREALRDVMPASINGMERTSISSARDGAMGMTVTHAEAEYEEGDAHFALKVTDLAGVPFAGMAGAAWAMADIDRESDTEIERTTTYRGNRAYEKYNMSSNRGEFSVMVDGFLVEGSGRNMSRAQILASMDDAPIAQLSRLR